MLYALSEGAIRTYLQSLYVGLIGSSNNARNFLYDGLERIGRNSVSGNKLVRYCLLWAVRWLRLLQEYTISLEVFNDQFLEPARCAARFILDIRETTPRTAKLRCLAFARSKGFYDSHFNGMVSNVSMLVPELGVAMSLRCREEQAEELRYGTFNLEGVQPIPFSNRIHPVHLSFRRESDQIGLAQLDCFKVNLSDIGRLRRALAFENFCEIESSQYGRRRLGAAYVLSGNLHSVDPPFILLRSVSNPEVYVRLIITHFLLERFKGDVESLRIFQGKPVRVLAAVWYSTVRAEPPAPEAFCIEGCGSEKELLADDATAQARWYGISPDRAKPHHGDAGWGSFSSYSIDAKDGAVRGFPDLGSRDKIVIKFVEQRERLRSLRGKISDPHGWGLVPDLILNPEKLQFSWLVRRISQDRNFLEWLTLAVKLKDDEGSLPSSKVEFVRTIRRMRPDLSPECLFWLRCTGLIVLDRGGVSVTPRGLKVAYLANRERLIHLLRNALKKGPLVLCLPELEQETGLPPSLIVRCLGELRKESGIRCLTVNGVPIRSIWMASHSENARLEAEERLEVMANRVLSAMAAVHHPIGIGRILEMLKERGTFMPQFTVREVLSYLKAKARVEELESIEGWNYQWKARIRDILSAHPYHAFTLEEILEQASLPPSHREEVTSFIKQLAGEGLVLEILPGKWACSLSDDEAERKRLSVVLKGYCRDFIIKETERRPVYVRTLLGRAQHFLFTRMTPHTRMYVDPMQLCKEVLNEMIASGEVIGNEFIRRGEGSV